MLFLKRIGFFVVVIILVGIQWEVALTDGETFCRFTKVPDSTVYSLAGGKVELKVEFETNSSTGFLRLEKKSSSDIIYVVNITDGSLIVALSRPPYNFITFVGETSNHMGSFVFSNVTQSLEGTYTIDLSRCGDGNHASTVTLKRVDPPRFVENVKVKQLQEGQELNEPCTTVAEPKMLVTWRNYDNTKLAEGNGSAILTIRTKITRNIGGGVYTCCGKNVVGTICRNLTVDVLYLDVGCSVEYQKEEEKYVPYFRIDVSGNPTNFSCPGWKCNSKNELTRASKQFNVTIYGGRSLQLKTCNVSAVYDSSGTVECGKEKLDGIITYFVVKKSNYSVVSAIVKKSKDTSLSWTMNGEVFQNDISPTDLQKDLIMRKDLVKLFCGGTDENNGSYTQPTSMLPTNTNGNTGKATSFSPMIILLFVNIFWSVFLS